MVGVLADLGDEALDVGDAGGVGGDGVGGARAGEGV